MVGGQEIGTTPEHPFYVQDRGWAPAGALEPGQQLRTEAGWVAVDDVRPSEIYEKVYNLRVADFHTYFVGDESWGFAVWAHNAYIGTYSFVQSKTAGTGYQAHHIGQDAVMRSLKTQGFNYSYYSAACINLFGQSSDSGTSHKAATDQQVSENDTYRASGVTRITIQQESIIARNSLEAARIVAIPGPQGPITEADITIAMTEFWKYFTSLTNPSTGKHPNANTLVTLPPSG